MKQKKRGKWINFIVFLMLAITMAILIYNYYLILVDQGKAESIENYRDRVNSIK